jgi:N-acetylneuraminate synthase
MPFIIAEIGINHNGSVQIAKELIDMAKECGCNAVKFQKRTVEVVYSKEYLDSPRESPWGNTQRHQKEGLEFGKEQYDEIDDHCRRVGIDWFASAWDLKSQQFLIEYDLLYNKIASAMLTNIPLLKAVAQERKYTFISTGMSTFQNIDVAVGIFRGMGCEFTLMHTTSSYPCEDQECNLLLIPELKKRYQCPVGYSGHEVGLLPSVIAVTLGATAIERHITLDRAMYGSDQSASLEKTGFQRLVRDTTVAHTMMGDGEKRIYPSEQKAIKSLRYWNDFWDNSCAGRE